MSTETATPVPTAVLDGADEAYPRDRQYVWVALALAGLTGIEIATYAAPGFPAWSWGDKAGLITVLMILMAVKFWTVAYFFMHLKFDKPLLTRVFYAGLILAVLVYVAVLTMFNVWYPGSHN
jgi:cytochrome c oxidase subunit 4